MRQFDYITELMTVALQEAPPLAIRGRVTQVIGTIIKAVIPSVTVGEVCLLRKPTDRGWRCRRRWSASPAMPRS